MTTSALAQRVSLITLGVADLARARRFYEEGLGWRRSSASADGVAFYSLGTFALALYPAKDLASDLGLPLDPGGAPRMTLAQNLPDREAVDAAWAQALAAGAAALVAPHDVSWGGYCAYFADPDGHVWELAWNPQVPLGEDGAFRLPD